MYHISLKVHTGFSRKVERVIFCFHHKVAPTPPLPWYISSMEVGRFSWNRWELTTGNIGIFNPLRTDGSDFTIGAQAYCWMEL